MSLRLLPYGERAVLVELAGPTGVLALSIAVRRAPGVEETIPGARTLLVRFDPTVTTAAALADLLEACSVEPPGRAPEAAVEIAVHYDGPDLAAVAEEIGISAEELIGRHAGAAYTVAFCGFAPGFAYLTGLDPSLHVRRLDDPRTAVPAGSVAVAGEFTGVYPRSSPGGWRLLGHTDLRLWDTARRPPALLTPGTPVRFHPA